MTRRQKIEQVLADWFRRNTDFSVSEGIATVYIGGAMGIDFGKSVDVDLTQLAEEIDQQFEKIGTAK